MSSVAKTKGFDIEKYFSFNGEKISARTELYEYDDIFYLGVAYRRAATEAYPFCRGSRPYQAARKNRHDKPARPDKTTNQWFSNCVDCWNSLPDWISQEDKCSGKLAKERYWEEKKATGVKCSYFDVFQRKCLKYWSEYKRCPPFCCDLEPNPASIGLCCGQSGVVKLRRPDGKIDKVPVSCGGFPGEYEFVYTDPDGYKACIIVSCSGPKPGKEWSGCGFDEIWTTEMCPPPRDYTSILITRNNSNKRMWYKVGGTTSPTAIVYFPEQYFMLEPGQCLGPVSWTWQSHWGEGPKDIHTCDGQVIHAFDSLSIQLWCAEVDPDECK